MPEMSLNIQLQQLTELDTIHNGPPRTVPHKLLNVKAVVLYINYQR